MNGSHIAALTALFLGALCAATTAQSAAAPDERLFPSAPTADATGGPRRFAFADVDGDGDLDAFDLYNDDTRFGDGHGRFGAGPSTSFLTYVPANDAVELGDFDGDGALDAAVGAYNVVQIYATVSASTMFPTQSVGPFPGVNFESLAAGDLDADGDLDLIATALNGDSRTLLNQGDGTFVAASGVWTPPAGRYRSIDLVDLDADGLPDLIGARIAANAPQVFTLPIPVLSFEVLRNVGSGFAAPIVLAVPTGFAAQAMNPVRDYVADFDGDGLADLAVPTSADSVAVMLQTPGFAFAQAATVAAPGGGVRVAAMRNAAGAPTAFVCGRDGHVALRYVGGGFVPTGAGPETARHVYRADVDGDGDDDAVCAEPGAEPHQYRVLFANASGGFVSEDSGLPWRFEVSAGSLGDADGDGDLDFFAYAGTAVARGPVVALNDGRGTFGAPVAATCVGCPPVPTGLPQPDVRRVLARDVDGDGDADLLVATAFGLFALRNDGAAGFTSIWNAPDDADAHGFACGDFDADGFDDVAYSTTATAAAPFVSEIRVALGIPGGYGAPTTIYSFLQGYAGTVLATDADDDGDLDLVAWAQVPGGSFLGGGYLFANLGGGAFGAPTLVFAPANFADTLARTVSAAADLDGDGDEDFLFGQKVVFRTGPATFSAPTALPSGALNTPHPIGPNAAVDFDGDGDVDLVGAGGAFLNAGGGTFATAAATLLPNAAVWGDVDGDGDADAVSNSGLVQNNRTRDLAAYYPLRPGRPALFGVFGAPGAAYLLAVDAGLGAPLATPFGPLWLDPATAFVVAAGTLPANGPALVSATLPANPALVGLSAALQAAVDGPLGPRLTDVRALTVRGF
jgi:hypothetical protein